MLFLVSLQYIVWNEQRRLWGRAGVFLWALARGAVVPSEAVPSCSWEVPGPGLQLCLCPAASAAAPGWPEGSLARDTAPRWGCCRRNDPVSCLLSLSLYHQHSFHHRAEKRIMGEVTVLSFYIYI